jgi:hypothetical protein
VGGESSSRLGHTQIVLWRSRGLPGALDALIVPEDTYLVLQTSTADLDPDATPLDLWASLERAARTEKRPLGSVIIADGKRRGVKYIASVIVYDFEAEPICCKEIVLAGLRNALSELVQRDCEAIGVFPLGTMPGGISQEEYFAALDEVARRSECEFAPTLYLLKPDPAPSEDPAA